MQCCCDGTWGCAGLWCFSGTPGQARTSFPAAAKRAVTKDTVQEDCPGIEQREPAPALLGDDSVPKPTANPEYPRHVLRGRHQDDFQETIPGPHLQIFCACSHSATFPGQREVPSIRALQQPLCPGGCYEAVHGRTLGTEIELRTARTGPFPKLHLLCPTTSLPQSPLHIAPSSFPEQL